MTTIATDGRTMAADGLSTAGRERVGFPVKVHRTPDGRLFGGCGPSAECVQFAKWMLGAGDKPELSDDFSGLVLTTDGRAFHLCKRLEPVEYQLPQAIGSGREYAIGAMMAGASPEEAVRIACERDVYSGGEVQTMALASAEITELRREA